MTRSSRLAAIAGLALLLVAGAARADGAAAPAAGSAAGEGWIVTLGGSFQLGPKYDRSNAKEHSFLPSLGWRRAGEPARFSAPDDNLDYALYESDRFSIGPVASFERGRYSGSDHRLRGLRDVPWTIEAGMFAEYWPILDRLRTRVEIRQGFHGQHGIVADVAADWVEHAGRFTFSGGPRLSLGSVAYMRRNFGITAQEALDNGFLSAYRPSAGVKSLGLAGAIRYDWQEPWATTLFARYDRLLREASHSPLVRSLGQRDQFTIGISAEYSFRIGR